MSDPAIGRFWQIDPLAEDYVYNSTYAFQENKMGMGVELEGLEMVPFGPLGGAMLGNSSIPIGPATNVLASRNTITTLSTADKVVQVGNRAVKTNEHHIIPRQAKTSEVVQAARKEGFKFEGKENKITVEQFSKSTGKGRHATHPKYNKEVINRLSDLAKEGTKGQDALNAVRNMVKDLKKTINNNPDTKINDLFLESAPKVEMDNVRTNNNVRKELPKVITPADKCRNDPNCA